MEVKRHVGLQLEDEYISIMEAIIEKYGGSKAGLAYLLICKCLEYIDKNNYPALISKLDAFDLVTND